MHAQAIPAALARALALYVLCGSLALALWLELPVWFPAWVLRHSPFLMPTARAAIAGHDAQGFVRRIDEWGSDAVPGLCRCLRHHQILVRRYAAQASASLAAHGPLDASLVAALNTACNDDDDGVARWALRALRRDGVAPAGRSAAGAPAAAPTAPAVRRGPAPASGVAPAKSAGDDEDDDDDDDEDGMPAAPPAPGPH